MKTLIALLVAAVALPLGASASADRASGTLDVNSVLSTSYRISRNVCPPGIPATTDDCVRFVGGAAIPGLGHGTVTYVKSFDQTICPGQVVGQKTSVFDIPGKGQITVAMDFLCANPAPNFTVTRGTVVEGTGVFARASGSLQVASMVNAPICGGGGCGGGSTDTWTGSLAVPGREFDLTPPVFQPIASKRVKAPRKAKTVRVRYSPQALDAVDGPMPVTCKPSSGSRFKVGRTTRVSCSAEDTSANVAIASFTVKVTRRR
jgi:hypothetical protein